MPHCGRGKKLAQQELDEETSSTVPPDSTVDEPNDPLASIYRRLEFLEGLLKDEQIQDVISIKASMIADDEFLTTIKEKCLMREVNMSDVCSAESSQAVLQCSS